MHKGNEEMLTTGQAAKLLGVTSGAVRQFIARGFIKAVKLDDTSPINLIPSSEIEKYRREHSPKPGPKPRKQKEPDE